MGSRARDAASVLAAPLLVKRLEELVGFVYERAYAIARRVLCGLFEQGTDEPIRAERRHEEGSRPHPWVRAPKRQRILSVGRTHASSQLRCPITYIGFRRTSTIPPPEMRRKSRAWIGPKGISHREPSQRRGVRRRRRRRAARCRRRAAP